MMLYRIKMIWRTYYKYPPTSNRDVADSREEILIESPLKNSVASFRKWVFDDLNFVYPPNTPRDAINFDSPITLRTIYERGDRIRFSREPHPIGFSENFRDERQFLEDDENLQYDEVVYVDYMNEG